MSRWRLDQLTFGSDRAVAHAHSYYDIPVIDGAGRRVLAHRLMLAGRHPTPDDAVEIGLADADKPGAWQPLGTSHAWSWQQGPLAQWISGGPWATWADREDGRLIARLTNVETGAARKLDRPLYAIAPAGDFALALDMGRIDALRPGYGFVTGKGIPDGDGRAPDAEGVWRIDLATGAARLILSLSSAVRFLHRASNPALRLRLAVMRPHYWFNHAKISPDGARFTVKLRWRRPGGHWDDRQGVSLTAVTGDGSDRALLARATSHVIWMDPRQLHLWQRNKVIEVEDAMPRGRVLRPFAGGAIKVNAHLRRLQGDRFVWDTPYREEVELNEIDRRTGRSYPIARFTGHIPANGPFRCDLHPCPTADGRRIVVTSTQDGARQVYALTCVEG